MRYFSLHKHTQLMKTSTPASLLNLLVFFLSTSLLAQEASTSGFIENKGQIVDQEYQPNPEVLYLFHSPNLNVQLRQTGFSYDTYTTTESLLTEETSPSYLGADDTPITATNYAFDRVDIDLVNTNTSTIVEASNSVGGYLNYYTPGVSEGGVLGVKTFKTIRYKNIYQGIDLEFSSDNEKMKYNFILQPEASLEGIKLRVNHSGGTRVNEKGSLLFETTNGTLEESIPYCFYETETGKQKVNGRFVANPDGTFGIEIDQKHNGVLVIDPIPEFLKYTYYGGSGSTSFLSLTEDVQRNILSCGITRSSNNIATSGAFQNIVTGNIDGMIVSFSNDLTTRNWGTYIGSQNYDLLRAIKASKSGDVYFSGVTYESIVGFGTLSSHKSMHTNINEVAIIGKMSNTGVLRWGTYYGQDTSLISVESKVVAMDILDENNILIAGTTTGTKDIAFNSPLQPSLSGANDVFIANFDSTGNIHWGGYVGGLGLEWLMSLHVTIDKSIYIAGGTTSSTMISTPGSFQPVAPPGIPGSFNSDGFLIKLNSYGIKQWGTYYDAVGSGYGTSLASDTVGNVFVFGRTQGTQGMGTLGADLLQVDSGLYCGTEPDFGYLAKFSNLGSRIWSTYVDPSFNHSTLPQIRYSVARDQIDVMVSFSCQRTTSTYTGNSSLTRAQQYSMFLTYNPNSGVFLRGSYLGNPNPSQNWSSRDQYFDMLPYSNDSVFYVSGRSTHSNWANVTPSTVRGFKWQSLGTNEGIILKFAYGCADLCDSVGCFAFTGDTAYCLSEDSLIEVGLDYTYVDDQMYGANSYQWTVQGPATLLHGQGDRRLILRPDSAGIVQLSVQAFSDCDTSILATHSFQIFPSISKPILNFKDTLFLCSGDSVVLETTTAYNIYQWADGNSDTVYTVREGGKYYVSSGNVRCQLLSDTLYVIEITPPSKPTIQWNPILKYFSASAGFSFQWYRNDTLIMGAVNQNYPPTQSGQFTVEIIDSNGCVSLRANQLPYYVTLEDAERLSQINIYPNPVNSWLHINSPQYPIEHIKIYDVQGKLIQYKDYLGSAAPKEVELDLNAFTVGMYLLEVSVNQDIVKRHIFRKE